MTVHIGPYEFDDVDYDAKSDVLYLSIGKPRPAADSDSMNHFPPEWPASAGRPVRTQRAGSSSTTSFSTRPRMSSRTCRTTSMGWPAGSVSCQSS